MYPCSILDNRMVVLTQVDCLISSVWFRWIDYYILSLPWRRDRGLTGSGWADCSQIPEAILYCWFWPCTTVFYHLATVGIHIAAFRDEPTPVLFQAGVKMGIQQARKIEGGEKAEADWSWPLGVKLGEPEVGINGNWDEEQHCWLSK